VKKFDLEERTAKLGEEIIRFAKSIPESNINRSLINQLVRAGTSIGANYMEACGGESRKDFIHKIGICKKEAKETLHWLRMIAVDSEAQKQKCRELWKEAHELVLIFSTIFRSRDLKN
jgi:four helix bundle protein